MDRLLRSRCALFDDPFSFLPLIVLVSIGVGEPSSASAGELSRLRDDVRAENNASDDDDADDERRSRDQRRENNEDYPYSGDCGAPYYGSSQRGNEAAADGLVGVALQLAIAAVSSPVGIPRNLLADDGAVDGYFPRFPYENNAPGYMLLDDYASRPRWWALRLRSDYAGNGGALSQTTGHVLLSTALRWELDAETSYLQERLGGGRHDQLWLGDCNLLYRFAQCERSQWRVGIGLNWLDDPIETNYGFNFTYGFDLFPIKPLVLSTELDWGTLGSAEAFHFRSTAGVVIHGLEAYVGYEYRDIDRFQFSGLVAGVRLWF